MEAEPDDDVIVLSKQTTTVVNQDTYRKLLYNQRSRPLVVRRENAALTHRA